MKVGLGVKDEKEVGSKRQGGRAETPSTLLK